MKDWKLPQLRAHQQWLLGKIDALEWVKLNCELSREASEAINDRLQHVRKTESETTMYIGKIMVGEEAVRAAHRAERDERLASARRRTVGGMDV
jgi:hypothetical protein